MRQKIFIGIILLLPIIARAQDSGMENFINDVCRSVVNSDLDYFNYSDESIELESENDDISEFVAELKKRYPDFQEDILYASDTIKIYWSHYDIIKGRPLNAEQSKNYRRMWGISRYKVSYHTAKETLDSLNSLKPDAVYIPVKEGWSKEKINRKEERAIRNKREALSYYSFSRPVFSKDFKYAVIQYRGIGRGCKYIFKFNGRKWKLLTEFDSWIS